MKEAKFLYQLTKVIQAYEGGRLSSELFNEQVDNLLASFDPESKDIAGQLRKLVRESKFPPHISVRILGKLEQLQPDRSHNRRAEDRVDENLQVAEAKTNRRAMDLSVPEIPISDFSPEPSAGPSPEISADSVNDASPEPSADVSPEPSADVSPEPSADVSPEPSADVSSEPSADVSPADSLLLRSLLNWQEGGRHKNIQPNEVIRGTYRLVSKVGKGGMGEVWKAVDLIQDAGDSRDRYVAIKFLSSDIRGHDYALKALVREFARYKKLIHSNIVRAYELNRDEDAVFIVMEFLPGLPLNQFIQKHAEGISLNEARPIIKGMCHALAYAHQEGVIHLDFKPGNVFYDPETGMTKVIDFGIARLAKQQERDETRFDPGALGAKSKTYATPEMLGDADPWSSDDVYGLSCVIYELLTGTHPFKGTNSISAEHQGLRPAAIKGLTKAQFGAIERGLAFRRKIRTESVDKLYQELFPESVENVWKLSRNAVIAALILVTVIGIPLLYRGIDSWRLQRIAAGVQQLDKEDVNRFHGLDSESQLELMMDELTRASLVRYYISKATPENNAFDYIQQLEQNVQRSLFRTRDIRKLLIVHSMNMIDQAVKDDNFYLAANIADRIAAQYPDSRLLADRLALVSRAKGKRLAELNKKFDDCLYDTTQSLVNLLPCLTESAVLLNRVDADRRALNNPRLSARFIRETRNALSEDDLDTADKLLSGWREMIPSGSSVRAELSEQLLQQRMRVAQKRDVAITLIQNVIEAGRFNDVLAKLDGLKESFSEVDRIVIMKSIKAPFLEMLSEQVETAFKNKDYLAAAKLAGAALERFSDDNSIINLGKQIDRAQADRVNELVSIYQALLNTKRLQASKLFHQLTSINSIDKEYLADHPDLFKELGDRVKTLIATDHPLVALQEIFAQWELFPIKTEESVKFYRSTKNYIALRCLFKAKALKSAGEIGMADEYVMFALSLSPPDKITDSLSQELAR